MSAYRQLSTEEISSLEKNGCRAENWTDVLVSDTFDPRLLLRVNFYGKVTLGKNVSISDSSISNYSIGENTIISRAGKISMNGRSSFGSGTPVRVLNESGGREVLLDRELSSQTGYIEAMYRHRPGLVSSMQHLTMEAAESSASEYGHIGDNVIIRNTGTVTNAYIGNNARLEDCLKVENGTICDADNDSGTVIGSGAICRNFIACNGAEISDGSIIENCFIGQCVKLSKGFTATDSLFFANSHCENGEAASVFAGPYTVSHHKSTLLIGGMYSYSNAGSNSNFSNHLYKLGPVHHGIFGRGTKFGSGSYVMLPACTGAFSTVIGHHHTHFDSSGLPFSYLIEKDSKTYIIPGVNLTGSGLFRDSDKWQKRDKRKSPKRDILNSLPMNPYTCADIIRGMELLEKMISGSNGDKSGIEYNGCHLNLTSASKGIERYRNAAICYIGRKILERLKDVKLTSDKQIRCSLAPKSGAGKGIWVDISGMIAPASEIETLLNAIEHKKFSKLQEIQDRLQSIHDLYPVYEWNWIYSKIQEVFGIDPDAITKDHIAAIACKWKDTAISVCNSIISDAAKEFAPSVKIGFGVKEDPDSSGNDFEAVRGQFKDSMIYSQIEDLKSDIARLTDNIISAL